MSIELFDAQNILLSKVVELRGKFPLVVIFDELVLTEMLRIFYPGFSYFLITDKMSFSYQIITIHTATQFLKTGTLIEASSCLHVKGKV